jgi:flagellin
MGSIRANINNLVAQRILGQKSNSFQESLIRLSTGLRINRGADDPAGLIASENLRATLKALEAETRANERTLHVAATTEAALTEVGDLINRAEALAVANANTGALSDAEREANQIEMDSIVQTVQRIAHTAGFNSTDLLDGTLTLTSADASLTVPSANPSDIGQVTTASESYSLADLASGGSLDLRTGDAQTTSEVLRQARLDIAFSRGSLGTFSRNTLQTGIRSGQRAFEQTAAAESIIRDTDFAAESSNLIRQQILQTSAGNALNISSHQPANVLGLFA